MWQDDISYIHFIHDIPDISDPRHSEASGHFYLRVSAVIATATWLGGWLVGCLSQWVLYQND